LGVGWGVSMVRGEKVDCGANGEVLESVGRLYGRGNTTLMMPMSMFRGGEDERT
jgi:hypothetical protein